MLHRKGVSRICCVMEFPRLDTAKFIDTIEATPALWNSLSKEYSKRVMKKNCWIEVARKMLGDEEFEELSIDGQAAYISEIQKKWKGLRNSFARELARQRQSKNGSNETWKTYVYFERLQFLMGSSKRAARESIDSSLDFKIQFEDEEDVLDANGPSDIQALSNRSLDDAASNSSRPSESNQEEDYIPSVRRSPKNDKVEAKRRIKKEKTISSPKIDRKEEGEVIEVYLGEDEDRMFLLSLLGDLKRVPAEHKMDVKLQIMQAIRRYSS